MIISFNIKRFLASKFLASLADQFMLFAVPLIILKYTGSVKWSALAFAIEWTPRLIFLPVAGHLADRVNINRLFIVADCVRAITVGLAAMTMWVQPTSAFWVLSVTMATLSVFQSLAFIAMESSLPRYLPAESIPKAQSLLQISDQTSFVLGPALAGFMVTYIDIRWVLGLGTLLFLVSLVNSLSLPRFPKFESQTVPLKKVIFHSYMRGIQIIRENPILIQLMSLVWLINVLFGSVLILFPAVITQVFKQSTQTYSYLMTACAALSLTMSALSPRIVAKYGLHKLGLISLISVAFGSTIASLAPQWMIFGAGAILVLGADSMFNIYVRSMRARIIPKSEFGKATGIIILINNSSIPVAGVCISHLSKYFSQVQIMGLMTAIALVLFCVVLTIGKMKFKYETVLPNINSLKGNRI